MIWPKKHERLYPALYSEWITEFKKMDSAFLSEQDAEMLKKGYLKDSKYSIDFFVESLSSFLEKQIAFFFQDFRKLIQINSNESDSDYLLLLIRRYVEKYERLFFFESMAFLPPKYRNETAEQLRNKLLIFEKDISDYFGKISLFSPSMYYISLNVRRMIEV